MVFTIVWIYICMFHRGFFCPFHSLLPGPQACLFICLNAFWITERSRGKVFKLFLITKLDLKTLLEFGAFQMIKKESAHWMDDKTMSFVTWSPELTPQSFIDLLLHMKSNQQVLNSQYLSGLWLSHSCLFILSGIYMWGYGNACYREKRLRP